MHEFDTPLASDSEALTTCNIGYGIFPGNTMNGFDYPQLNANLIQFIRTVVPLFNASQLLNL